MNSRLPFIEKLRILKEILGKTGAGKMLMSFIGFVFADALIYIFDPGVGSYGDALWYCYDVISTTGFGDVVVTTPVARVCSVVLTVYAVLVIAIVTGVIVNYYNQIIEEKMRKEQSQQNSP